MPFIVPSTAFEVSDDTFDLVVIGSGFGSLFFLRECLAHLPKTAKVIVLERGVYTEHHRQTELGSNSADPASPDQPIIASQFFKAPVGHKKWSFTVGLGGGTLCWWGQAPRLHPSDFRLKSLYGRGADWPISYDDLEPFYCEAENIMGISGDSDTVGPFHRSQPYPLPAFRGSSADEALRAIDPNQISLPAARDSIGERRARCCAYGNCRLCPHDAKFTALNGMTDTLNDPRVTFVTGANVLAIEMEAGVARRAVVGDGTRRITIQGDQFVLGANAIFNPTIMMRSGLFHPELGRGITEQIGLNVEVKLTSLSGVNGGTSATGQNLTLIDGPYRRDHGAAVFYFDNRWRWQGLRTEVGKHLNTLLLVINAEDLRSPDHRIEVSNDWDQLPTVYHESHGVYAKDGLKAAVDALPQIFLHLEIDDIIPMNERETESHLQCSTPAGSDPETSIVDAGLIHHDIRNLAVVGTSSFSTCPVANPSLTAAAWSIRSARKLFGAN